MQTKTGQNILYQVSGSPGGLSLRITRKVVANQIERRRYQIEAQYPSGLRPPKTMSRDTSGVDRFQVTATTTFELKGQTGAQSRRASTTVTAVRVAEVGQTSNGTD